MGQPKRLLPRAEAATNDDAWVKEDWGYWGCWGQIVYSGIQMNCKPVIGGKAAKLSWRRSMWYGGDLRRLPKKAARGRR